MSFTSANTIVIGGGIVGLATARAILAAEPGSTVLVLEKEPTLAAHQTGRNSGVIHSGLYYRPGSHKARLVQRGRALLDEFCSTHSIAQDYCGKVVVATKESQLAELARLEGLAGEHGIASTRLDPAGLRDHEPHATGVAALHIPSAGIVDYREVTAAIAKEITEAGGTVLTSHAVTAMNRVGDDIEVVSEAGTYRTSRVVNCGGLRSDQIARMLSSSEPTSQSIDIVPFRGEYYDLTAAATHLVRHLIYPVPDPAFPFLGVHFTRSIHGGIHAGPNAVLALAREGYSWSDIDPSHLRDLARNPGLRVLAKKYWRTGAAEMWRSASKAAFVSALQELVPAIESGHLVKSDAGVRAQALRRDGFLVDDFAFERVGPVLNVINAPSPAATASLAIAEHIVGELNRS